jgi:hypothetical protein
MIKLNFDPPKNPSWEEWCADAVAEHALLLELYASRQPISIKDSLYKRRSKDFFDNTWKKCAYCEALIILDQTGDVEHFRPKGKVTDENDRIVEIDCEGERRPHPGYFWLAYDWRNLLPSCIKCNRPARTSDGRLVGKSTRFPVKGARATSPGEIEREEPMLINPLLEDPGNHLDMDVETGVLFHKSERGHICIKILDLNREGLPEARMSVYEDVLLRAGDFQRALLNAEKKRSARQEAVLLSYKTGLAEYSLAGRKALETYKNAIRIQENMFG